MVQPLAVKAEVREGSGLLFHRAEHVVHVLQGAEVGVECHHVGFHGRDTEQPPGEVGEELDESGFGGSLSLVCVVERWDVEVVDFGVLAGDDDITEVRPWRRAFREDICLPWAVLGPVEC